MTVLEVDIEDCIEEIKTRLISYEHMFFKNILHQISQFEAGKEERYVFETIVKEEANTAKGYSLGIERALICLEDNSFLEAHNYGGRDLSEELFQPIKQMCDNYFSLFMKISLYTFEISQNKEKFFEICNDFKTEVNLILEYGEKLENIKVI